MNRFKSITAWKHFSKFSHMPAVIVTDREGYVGVDFAATSPEKRARPSPGTPRAGGTASRLSYGERHLDLL
ncbi:MAG: hypothetical protein LAO78_07645 [Acidobacteriia bacterium]|nr:hypothetical protein [Terriglobia bacterium]